jgi:glycosyltransferase involved in cell wall biosynthesis
MNNNKIAFFCNSESFGGLELNIVRLAHRFMQKGWDVTMIARNESAVYCRAVSLGIKVLGTGKIRKHFDYVFANRIKKFLSSNGISTLFCTDNKDLNFIFTLRTLCSIKTIYIQQMQLGVNKKDLYHTSIYKAIDYWVSPLEILKDEVLRKTNFPESGLRVIPLGFDEKILKDKLTKSECREILDLPEDVFLCGIPGRFDIQKGQDFLIDCICAIRVNYDLDIGLVLMGEPTKNEGEEYYNSLLLKIKDNNLEKRIFMRGFRDDVNIFYDAIDVFTLASKSETYGMVTVEAMAKGLPVIATNSGGTVELLGNGEYGLLYTPNDKEDFIEKLKLLFSDKNLRDSFAQKASAESISKYTLEHQYQMLSELIPE